MRGALIVLLAGCHKLLGLEPASVPTPDSSFDSPPPGTLCAGVLYFQECAFETDVQDLTLDSPIDTDSSVCTKIEMQTNGGPNVCVIIGRNVSVHTMVRAHGSRPLAVFALRDFTVDANAGFSASSDATLDGPNANQIDCAAPPGENQMGAGNVSGGGAGGSYGGMGGDGGFGTTMQVPAKQPFNPPLLRAGCRGGLGGLGSKGGAPAALGGSPGGAIYLVAGGTLTMNGLVAANGAGGKGGPKTTNTGNMYGGGGGGSGGAIALDAPTIVLGDTALLLAMGGGGGGGGDGANGAGSDGADPSPIPPIMQAGGGGGGTPTGDSGGRGCSPIDPDAGNGKPAALAPQGGGGGGGGACGLIHLVPASTMRNGTIVPTPT